MAKNYNDMKSDNIYNRRKLIFYRSTEDTKHF